MKLTNNNSQYIEKLGNFNDFHNFVFDLRPPVKAATKFVWEKSSENELYKCVFDTALLQSSH